jgi:hypothetical protein
VQHINQSINHSVSQSINQSIIQATNKQLVSLRLWSGYLICRVSFVCHTVCLSFCQFVRLFVFMG